MLLLFSDPSESPGSVEFSGAVRRTLLRAFPVSLQVYVEHVDLVYADSPSYQETLARLLHFKYADHPPDLVVPIGSGILRFVLENRESLFPEADLLFGHVERSEIGSLELPPDAAGVVARWGFDQSLDLALHLLPSTRRAVVILGAGSVERYYEPLFRREFRRFEDRIPIEWWVGLPMRELQARVSRLPPHTVVIYISIYRDGTGAQFIPPLALEQLSKTANAPIFSSPSSHLGYGVVGDGRWSHIEHGEQVGRAAVRILRGEPPRAVGLIEAPPGAPHFDGRELVRWGISEDLLPAGSHVEGKEPSIWERYRGAILLIAVVVVAESVLIAVLLMNRARLRRARHGERRASSLMRALFESLHERIAILDRQGVILSVNPAWSNGDGPAGDSLPAGADYLGAVASAAEEGRKDLRELAARLRAVLGGELGKSRLEIVEADERGGTVLEASITPLGREEGGAVVAFQDVTERRRADLRFRTLVESVPVAILLVGSEGTVLLVNAEAERLFGWAREEIVGKPVEVLVPEAFREAHPAKRAELATQAHARKMGDGKVEGRRRDGIRIPIEVVLRPIAHDGGVAVLCTVLDLTERRQVEQERAQHLAETAHWARVAVVGELSAAIAHELNQPLTGIMTNVQAAQTFLSRLCVEPDDLTETLSDIAADGRRAGEVIQRLRSLLRKGPLELRPVDLNELVEQTGRLMASDLLLRGSALDLELTPGLPRILGDRVHLQQVLINLMLNGIEAMAGAPAERRRLLVRTTRTRGRKVQAEVRDGGTGIGEDAMPHLFEPFFTTRGEGLGMGLSIVRSIVERHGGEISAHNNPGGGASFVVVFPEAAHSGEAA